MQQKSPQRAMRPKSAAKIKLISGSRSVAHSHIIIILIAFAGVRFVSKNVYLQSTGLIKMCTNQHNNELKSRPSPVMYASRACRRVIVCLFYIFPQTSTSQIYSYFYASAHGFDDLSELIPAGVNLRACSHSQISFGRNYFARVCEKKVRFIALFAARQSGHVCVSGRAFVSKCA